jgi:hypothetical protein
MQKDLKKLVINYHKSEMIIINMDDQRLEHFTDTSKCKKVVLIPPTLDSLLGIGLTRTTLKYFLPMIQRVERRICRVNNWWIIDGKLQMVKYVLSPLGITSCVARVGHNV